MSFVRGPVSYFTPLAFVQFFHEEEPPLREAMSVLGQRLPSQPAPTCFRFTLDIVAKVVLQEMQNY
jgi:hypothetical protein